MICDYCTEGLPVLDGWHVIHDDPYDFEGPSRIPCPNDPLNQPSDPGPATPVTATARRHRHRWKVTVPTAEARVAWLNGPDYLPYWCACGAIKDTALSRRGKSSARLGKDQERRIERVYGPTKIGERGDPVDHLGKLGKWQSKSTRGPVPKWLADPMRKMDGLYGDRIPLLILSYVRQGVPVEDYILMRGSDFLDWHGRDEE